MIHYVVPAYYRGHSVDSFLDTWGEPLRGRLCPLTYKQLFRREKLAPGVVILTHFEGISPEEERLVRSLHARLSTPNGPLIAMNDPARVLGRYELGVRLFESGINDFRPRYLDEDLSSVRFPAFVRLANEHRILGVEELVHSAGDLQRTIEAIHAGSPGLKPRDAIVVEFCDVSERGLYRKYSALRIGDEIIPRHILFSSHWITKYPSIVDADKAAEEHNFIHNFEHADRIREVFDIAGIEYGRVDYSFHRGRLRVWEINTNPVIVPPPGDLHPDRMVSQSESARLIIQAFERLDALVPAGPDFKLWRWFESRRRRQAREAGKRLASERKRKIGKLQEAFSHSGSDS